MYTEVRHVPEKHRRPGKAKPLGRFTRAGPSRHRAPPWGVTGRRGLAPCPPRGFVECCFLLLHRWPRSQTGSQPPLGALLASQGGSIPPVPRGGPATPSPPASRLLKRGVKQRKRGPPRPRSAGGPRLTGLTSGVRGAAFPSGGAGQDMFPCLFQLLVDAAPMAHSFLPPPLEPDVPRLSRQPPAPGVPLPRAGRSSRSLKFPFKCRPDNPQ